MAINTHKMLAFSASLTFIFDHTYPSGAYGPPAPNGGCNGGAAFYAFNFAADNTKFGSPGNVRTYGLASESDYPYEGQVSVSGRG